ncbi:MAG: ThiF family adenylyltransferase [Candidatus Uhrbacteria bacterium]
MGEQGGTNLTVSLDRQRQLDIVNPAWLRALPVTVIGAGGIGSPTVILLAKMGCEQVTVYDFDVVEAHNVPNQWYRLADVGKGKVAALQESVLGLSGVTIVAKAERFVAQSLRGIVIIAVDNMDTRKAIWERCRMNPGIPLFIEGRMGAEQYHVFAVRPCDERHITAYELELFPQSQAAELPCTARAIIFNTFSIGAEICWLVKCEAVRRGNPAKARMLPFHIMKDFTTGTYVVRTVP